MHRKTIAASAIVLSLLLLVGAAAGTNNRPLGSGQDGTFTFAPLRIGDQGQYSVAVINDDGEEIIPAEPLWTLQWAERTKAIDFEGRERDVVLAYHGWTERDDGKATSGGGTWAVEPGTWDLVHYAYLSDPTVEVQGDVKYEQYQEQRFFIDDELYLLPCPSQNRYAGQTVDLSNDYVLFKHCDWHDHWAEEVRLKAIHTGPYGEDDSVTFRSGLGNLYQATFVPDISFPVEMVVEVQKESSLFYLIRLESFTRGSSTFPTTAAPAGTSQFTPLQDASWDRFPFGVFDHAYPVDEALQDARDHPDGGPINDWIDSHPDWYVAEGTDHQTIDQRGNVNRTIDSWSIRLSDGTDHFGFMVYREVTQPTEVTDPTDPTDPDLGDPTSTLNQSNEPTTEFRLEDVGPWSPAYPVPAKTVLPMRLPTATSLVPRWELFADDREASATSFRTGCVQDCEDWFYEVSVGVSTTTLRDDGTESMRASFEFGDRPATGPSMEYFDSWLRSSPANVAPLALATDSTAAVVPGSTWTAPTERAAFTVGSIGLLGGLVAFAWPALRNAGLIRLFSRIQGDRLLDHPQRQRIMEVIYASPGIHLRELRKRLDMGSGVTDHHIRKMEFASIIQVDRRGSYVCLYPMGHMDHSAMAAVPAMKADGARAIVDALKKGSATQTELADRTGLSKGTLSYHLKRLADAGAVDFEKEGRTRRITLTAIGKQAASAAA